MKILLVGNYEKLEQQSMQRYAELLRELLQDAGHEVRLLRPRVLLGRIRPGTAGIGKWLGYVDQYILFRPALWRAARKADVVHVCDHSNAMYTGWIGGKPHVVTGHDLLAVRSALGEIPGNRTRWTGRIYQRWILASLRRARLVLCVSEQTRNELLRLSGLPAQRCRVVHNALNYPYRPMPAEEAVFWSDVRECAAICRALLADSGRRERIRQAGMARVRAAGYGNEAICREILERLTLSDAMHAAVAP